MSAAAELSLDDFDVISPALFESDGYPHALWKRLRAESPVHFFPDGPLPYWAVTKHEDITHVGRNPDLFISGPRIMVRPDDDMDMGDFERPATLIEMDNPRHRVYRRMISDRFTPRALKKIHADVDRIARKIVDDVIEQGDGEIDFVEKIAAPLPIAVIAWLLGVPESDWKLLYDWTNRTIGVDDPEFHTSEDMRQDARNAIIELFTYFAKLVEERKKSPKDDLITLFANVEEKGEKLAPLDVLAWCQIIVVAGNETTRNATSGGMLAMIENQDQLARLQGDMSLLKPAVEEVLRWSSPIIHFARTATADTELRGQQIKKDDVLGLFYPSANRDEEIFEDPESFRIDRKPNRHLAFGVGEHFCAGAHVARLELEMAYKYFLPRLAEVELAAPVDRLRSNLVGGIKRLPIRYRIS